MARKTDTGHATRFRTDRFFRVNENEWFFTTREDGDKGPYPTREHAECALLEYVREKTGEYNPSNVPWLVPGTYR
jgi:hypothetical protein